MCNCWACMFGHIWHCKHLSLHLQPPAPHAIINLEIQTQVTISCNDAKAIAVPPALIQEHDECKWLQLRPTSQPLSQIVFGEEEAGKNASFSNHQGFQDLITKRNTMWTSANTCDEECQPGKPKRKRAEGGPQVMQVQLGDANIDCVMQGQKPTKSDLVVPLEEDQLKPIFLLLQEEKDMESLKHRQRYKKSRESKENQLSAENEDSKE